MKYYKYEELEKIAEKQLRAENPHTQINIKTIGLWLKKSGYKKIRKQINKERRLYYYLPDDEKTNNIVSSDENISNSKVG